MKNKEIVKRLKDSLDYEFDLSFSDRKELLSCIEQLEVDYKEANDSVTWWQNRYNAVERDKKQLENNRDKANELLEKYNDKENNYYVPVDKCINILRGEIDNE